MTYERIDNTPKFDGKIRDSHEVRYRIASQYVGPDDIVLDAGAGFGYGVNFLSTGKEYHAIDKEPLQPWIACADFNLPGKMAVDPFDVFVGLEVIEHLTDDGVHNFLEVARQARKYIIISTPIVPNANPYHIQKFKPESIPTFFAPNPEWKLYGKFVQDDKYGIFIFKRI